MINNNSIFAVTVTYGNRWHLLQKTVDAALHEGADKVIIVNNGSIEDIETLAKNAFGEFVDVITLLRNTGSAGGFDAGIKYVQILNPDYILLLDDDNEVQPNALNALISQYLEEVKTIDSDSLALLAFRPVRLKDVSLGLSSKKINPRVGSYFGFHALDVPFKIFRRIPLFSKIIFKDKPTENVYLNSASWSGLFFKPTLIKKYGYPETNFVLYADDTEFTLRITKGNGRIALCTSALIEDLDASWNMGKQYTNTFDSLLLGSSDFRAYYSTRNQTYLEYHKKKQVFFWSWFNRCLHKAILFYRAFLLHKLPRLNLLLQAMSDGKNKRLGINEKFPIY